jgi:cellulose synthase/poly-beta-1,6-N-acetylglucosamine synthase-like glycosyltransferase
MEIIFFISAGFIAYTYIGYFLGVVLRGTLFPRGVEKRYQTPPVSVVVAAHNEEINIRTRIENLRAQDYPQESVEIIIVSDGSTDRTVEIAREFGDDGVHVIEFDERRGKAAALNAGLEKASHEIIVFADARQRFSENALAELTAALWDESVGAVSGELVIEAGAGSEVHEGVGMYWHYEKLIRRMESRISSVVGATGSIYAIRKRLYVPLEPHTLLDDFLVPMRIVLQGYRVLFVRSARAFDISSMTTGQEFRRKVRTLAGNFQAVNLEPRLLSPRKNPVFVEFVSHKLARLAVPYFFAVSLVSSGLADGIFYSIMFWLQVALLGLGVIRYTPMRSSWLGAVGRVSWTFTVLNAAAVMALWVFVTGKERAVWKKA